MEQRVTAELQSVNARGQVELSVKNVGKRDLPVQFDRKLMTRITL